MPNGMSPGRLTAMPSAMVGLACTDTGCPAASEPGYGATASSWPPTTWTSWPRPLIATLTRAAGPFGVGEPGDPVVGTAHLERPGPLQVLAFQEHRPGHGLGQRPGVEHGRVRDHIAD